MRTPPEMGVTESFKIAGEPCSNPDWKPYAETPMDFADRMCLERGWVPVVYELPRPRRIGQYPYLRVDEDSILWKVSSAVHIHITPCYCNPKKDIGEVVCYTTTPENHLVLMDEFEAEGLIAGEVNAPVRKKLSEIISNRP